MTPLLNYRRPQTLLLVCVAFLCLASVAARAVERPNILWLIAEDFGQHLGCYGTREVSTPNLDRLAAEGVMYTHFYVGVVCSVSRSSFMTGMYSTSIGAQNHRTKDKKPLPEGVRPLTEWLRDAGYFTANVKELPVSCGFSGTGKVDWNFLTEGKPFESQRWEELKAHQPFYAQVNFHETHRVNHAPAHADPAKVEIPPYYPEHEVTRKDWAEYLDAATELDRKVGTLLEALRSDGLADNTVVVFFGDNGQSHVRGKQFCYEEGSLVPLLIRWPKNFPEPARFRAGSVDARMLQGIDLSATTLDMAGVGKPAKMQGRVFFGDRCEAEQRYVFSHRDRCDMTVMRIRSVRDERYRYIRNFTSWVPFLAFNEYKAAQYPVWTLMPKLHKEGRLTLAQEALCQSSMPGEELYDMESDPWQMHNLVKSGKAADKEALERLRAVLERWIEETNDQGRNLETLAQLQAAEPRFVAARDWRPQPGTAEAAEAEALRAGSKDQPAAEVRPLKKPGKKKE